jgi:hypothetical protein
VPEKDCAGPELWAPAIADGDHVTTMPTAVLPGRTVIVSRTAHLPHFLEEISHVFNTGLEHAPDSYRGTGAGDISHVVFLGEGRGASPCESYTEYVPQLNWAPSGSLLNTTLQFGLLRATGASIVSSWGVRYGHRVCFEKPRWPNVSDGVVWFKTPAICAAFRRGVQKAHSLPEEATIDAGQVSARRPKIVVALRGKNAAARGSAGSDLDAFNVDGADVVRVVLGHTPGAKTAEEQIRLVYSADAFVGMHGAAFALVALMHPGAVAGTLHPVPGNGWCFLDSLASSLS